MKSTSPTIIQNLASEKIEQQKKKKSQSSPLYPSNLFLSYCQNSSSYFGNYASHNDLLVCQKKLIESISWLSWAESNDFIEIRSEYPPK